MRKFKIVFTNGTQIELALDYTVKGLYDLIEYGYTIFTDKYIIPSKNILYVELLDKEKENK